MNQLKSIRFMHFQPATKCLPLGGCDLEGRNYMLLNAEITMLKNRLIRASQYVNCLTHPYMLKISQMIDVRLDEFERIKKLLL